MHVTPLHPWIGSKVGRGPEGYTRSDLEAWQLARLRETICLVRLHSPFYRRIFADCLSEPAALEDLAVFPFTTAADLSRDPHGFVCVPQGEVSRIVTLPTSGTSGPPKRVFFTTADQELTVDFFRVGMSTLAGPDDRVLILLPGQRPGSVGDLLRQGLERLGCLPVPHGPVEDEASVLNLILAKDVNIIVGAPAHLHRLAAWDRLYGLLPSGRIERVLSSTDILPDAIIENLHRQWGCEVFDHYGMTETGLGGGVECEAHAGYHLREADLYYEVVDPVSGRPLPEGEEGEVVFTTLTRVGMPLVRYRTGDISRLLPGACACGSFVRRLGRIERRLSAGVRIGSETIFPNDLDKALFRLDGLLDFRAAAAVEAGCAVLYIEPRLAGAPVAGLENRILDAVSSIPALSRLLLSRDLRVEITSCLSRALPAQPAYAKRRIDCIDC